MATERQLSHKRGGKKAVKHFELTLARSSLSKAHVFSALEEFCQSICVSEETHTEEGLHSSQHFHCYLFLHEPSRIVDLRGIVGINLYGDEMETWESIHLSTLRNPKHWLKYITKEDPYPMYSGLDSGMFHQAWKIHNFVRNNEVFDTMHPFLRQNPSLINILRKTHAEFWTKKTLIQHAQAVTRRPVWPAYDVDWVHRATMALSQRKHVYLYGPTGVGKSVLLTHYALALSAVWLPCAGSAWEFGDVENNTRLAIAGDAPSGYFDSHRSIILRLCDRDPVSVNVKCGAFKSVVFSGSLVIISNFPPPSDPAFLRRFEVIFAEENGFVSSKEEVIEIPSSPSDTEVWISSDSSDEGCSDCDASSL